MTPDESAPPKKRGGGRPKTPLIQGTLLPFYRLLKQQLPHCWAAQNMDKLCIELYPFLPKGKSQPTPQSLSSLLGGLPEKEAEDLREKVKARKSTRQKGVHPAYFAAFKKVFRLDELGFTDAEILAADPSVFERRYCDRPSKWLWSMLGSNIAQDGSAYDDAARAHRGGTRITFVPEAISHLQHFGPGSSHFAIYPETTINAFKVGDEYRLKARLPFEGHVLILSQDPTVMLRTSLSQTGESVDDVPTFCLNIHYGIEHSIRFGPGDVLFPKSLSMDPPEGLTRTMIMVKKTPFQMPWSADQSTDISHEHLLWFLSMLKNTPPPALSVGCMEYWVGKMPTP